MAPRPVWQGHLRLSLVTCPVALYSATQPGADVSFHMINPDTGNRIRMIATDPEAGPVERSHLVKGYEFEKNQHVILTDEEIDSVRIESTRTIDIDRFVEAADIDRLYWNAPFFLVPDGKLAAEAYAVILKAMADSKKVALGRVVMHTRERLIALEPRGRGIVATTLRAHDEVRAPDEFFDEIPKTKADAGMVSIASKIVEQMSGEFDPGTFRDRYEDALHDLIKAKIKGKAPRINAPEPEDTSDKDLMELLRQSLQKAGAPSRPKRAAKTAPKRAPAHKPARRASGGRR